MVGATVASFPGNGGIAWERLSWVLGFRRLGYDVLWVDQLGRGHCVASCRRPARTGYDELHQHPVVREHRRAFRARGLGLAHRRRGREPFRSFLRARAGDGRGRRRSSSTTAATCGTPRSSSVHAARCTSTSIPASPSSGSRRDGRCHASRGTTSTSRSARTSARPPPTCRPSGIEWRHTRQPVVLDEWPFVDEHRGACASRPSGAGGARARTDPWTTSGSRSRSKGDELVQRARRSPPNRARVRDRARNTRGRRAARRCSSVMAGASSIPRSVAADPDSFRRYVQGSWAEFSVAKGAYVETS